MAARQEAYQDWKNGMGPKQIAEKYGVSLNTVKSWLSRSKREDEKIKGAPSEEIKKVHPAEKGAPRRKGTLRKEGGQPGNKNAVGNAGGAPLGNTNAVKHGFYWDALTAEEQSLLEERQEPTDEERLLSELHLWEVRERRLLQSIAEQRVVASGLAVDNVMRTGNKTTTTAISTAENIRKLETLLTAAQRAHLRCIESLRELKRADGGEGDGNMDQLIESLAAAREMWGDKE